MKFGGSSVANGKKIRHVAKLIADNRNEECGVVAVVSALEGVTNQLIQAAEETKKGNREYISKFKQEILERHLTTAKEAIKDKNLQAETEQVLKVRIEELEKVLTGIVYVGELTPKSRDTVISFGERLSAPIVSGALKDLGLNSKHFTGGEAGIVTDANFGEAGLLMNVTKFQVKKNIEPLLKKRTVPVLTGFIAETQNKETTTLGRGGSDYTATIVGASLDADEVWIWTDVDGLMTSDPKIVPEAKTIPELSFQEATELTIFGAKAMHPRALEPARKEGIPVRIRNVFSPDNPGTLIVKEQKVKTENGVKAVTIVKNVAVITVSGAGMVGAPGTAAKVFEVLGKENINILMISQSVSEANISLVIQRNLLDRAVNILEIALLGREFIREIVSEDDVCVVAVLGAGMKGIPGVASRIFTAIAKEGINVRMIAQGSSELNVSFVVKENDGEETVRAIHKEFKLSTK
ncbi:MAG: aspartate kinase, monofunctional class [Candidatus Bathyarchaeum sp.]|nr:MAG: aspartate kinase, monofunctional class [Candidatus Bathyarchaeum sp.]